MLGRMLGRENQRMPTTSVQEIQVIIYFWENAPQKTKLYNCTDLLPNSSGMEVAKVI